MGPPAAYSNGFWPSRNLREVAFYLVSADNADIWLLATSPGAVPRRMTFDAANDIYPVLSTDGGVVLFGRQGTIYRRPVNGTGAESVYLSNARANAIMEWSPDGRHLLLSSAQGVAIATDGKVETLIEGNPRAAHAQFSPDGRWVAYDSGSVGLEEVFVEPFPRMGAKFQVSVKGGWGPRWRGDGKELYYVAQDATLMAVPVTLDGTFTVGPALPLFEVRVGNTSPMYWPYMPAPDGQRFLVLRAAPQAGDRPTLKVLTNWVAVPTAAAR